MESTRCLKSRRDLYLSLPHLFLTDSWEVFTSVTMKHAVFWDVTPCDFCQTSKRLHSTFQKTAFFLTDSPDCKMQQGRVTCNRVTVFCWLLQYVMDVLIGSRAALCRQPIQSVITPSKAAVTAELTQLLYQST
jgi:hypothetical protein